MSIGCTPKVAFIRPFGPTKSSGGEILAADRVTDSTSTRDGIGCCELLANAHAELFLHNVYNA